MFQQTTIMNTELISDANYDFKPGESYYLELTAPDNGRPFFWGFEIPDGKKVFYLGADVVGTTKLRLRFYNSETNDIVNVKAFNRQ